MTEAERVRLYNDLCDYEQELKSVLYPQKTREIDIMQRAIKFVKGEQSRWIVTGGQPVLDENSRVMDYTGCTCERCKFSMGMSSFRYCPNCSARMK